MLMEYHKYASSLIMMCKQQQVVQLDTIPKDQTVQQNTLNFNDCHKRNMYALQQRVASFLSRIPPLYGGAQGGILSAVVELL